MKHTRPLQSLSDDELLEHLSELVRQSRRIEADLVAHIGEVDERMLYARKACSSMFVYCTEVLHLSEPEAYLRIGVARAARKFPLLLVMLADGRLHLSGIALLAPHLTDENFERVLARAEHRSKRKIEELVAELAPKPDVPAAIRKSPTLPPAPIAQLRPDGVVSPPPPPSNPLPTPPPKLEPLAPERYKVSFTASAELREKLERLQDLMDEDLAAVIEAAVTEKLERLEAKRFGTTKSPRKSFEESDTYAKSRYIAASVKRIVSKRDGYQCTFVDGSGRRCTERRGLEFHHDDPYGRGGDHDPTRIRLLCRAHNLLLAERDYGKAFMNKYRRNGCRVSEPPPGFDSVQRVGKWRSSSSNQLRTTLNSVTGGGRFTTTNLFPSGEMS